MSLAWIREHYGVPAERGARVLFGFTPGRITGSRGQYLLVRLGGDEHSSILHPTWNLTYPDVQEGPQQ